VSDDAAIEAPTLTAELSYEEETLWRNLYAPATSVPFVECVDSLSSVTRHTRHCDAQVLQQRALEIVRRHTVLQSRFVPRDGGAVRQTLSERDGSVRAIDLRSLPEEERERQAAAVANAELCEPFDIALGPLWRIALITIRDDEHVLAVTAHHLVFDGGSVGIVGRELSAYLDVQPAALPKPSGSYSDYVAWQRKQLTAARRERLRTFWLRKLEGLPDRRMAAARGDVRSTRSKHVGFSVPAEESAAIRQLSQTRRISISTTVLTLLAIVVHEWTDSTDVVIGLPISARPILGFESTVGLCLNVVAVRADLAGHPSFVDLMSRVWSAVVDAYDHRAFPYECLVDALGARTGNGPPPFRVVFNFTPTSLLAPVLPGLLGSDLPTRELSSVADISCHIRDTGAALDGSLVYKADLLSDSQMAEIAARLQQLACEVARDPDRPIRRRTVGFIDGAHCNHLPAADAQKNSP
jgi:hypothetical protein